MSNNRSNIVKRIRGRHLDKIRQEHFSKFPLCVKCLEKGLYVQATELDHIIALTNGGKEERSNRQGLCNNCHKEKTIIDLNYKPVVKTGLDGFPME